MKDVSMRRPEQVAKYVIETVLEGAYAQFRAQQSNGECDFDLRLADGSSGEAEVTSATIQKLEQALQEIRRQKGEVPAVACRKSWLVHLLPNARVDLVRREVDRYLSAIEAEGLDAFYGPDGGANQSISEIFDRLGIDEGLTLDGFQVDDGPTSQQPQPASIWIQGPSGQGNIVQPGDLQCAIEREAGKTDNKSKLGATHRTQRHLFVYVTSLNSRPWSALINHCLPERPPVLPPEITHVWAAAEAPGGVVVWVAESPNRWKDIGVIPSLA
jgi:hypothetical protein